MTTKTIAKIGWIYVFLLMGIGIYFALDRYFIPEPYYTRIELFWFGPTFVQRQIPRLELHSSLTFLHVVPAVVFLMIGPLQFSIKMRMYYPRLHRYLGRIYVLIGILMAITSVQMAFVIPFAEFTPTHPWGALSEKITIAFVSSFFTFSLLKAVYHIRQREINKHREWMIRAFSVALGISSIRLIQVPLLHFLPLPGPDIFGLSVFTGWGAHIYTAEWWIRKTRIPSTSKNNK